MTKKIIFLLCTLFYANGAFAGQPQPLTSQETTIYNELMKKYEQDNDISREQIDQLLGENNLFIQNLHTIYTILHKKHSILHQEDNQLQSVISPEPYLYYQNPFRDPQVGGMFLLFAMHVAAIGSFIATPIITTGLAIKTFTAPSPTQKMISSGLIGTGTIIGSAIPVATGTFFILGELAAGLSTLRGTVSTGLSNLYERITHKQQKARIRHQAIQNEMQKIKNILHKLSTVFLPELAPTYTQPTYR